jgi:HIV Tat-specific factor 1
MYKDEVTGKFKGDALITYFKPESIPLCISLLDDCEFRVGKPEKISVQEATFKESDQKEKNTTGKKEQKVDRKRIEKARQRMEKKLEWFEQDEEARSAKLDKTVVMKYMFTLDELEKDPTLLLDLKMDVREGIIYRIKSHRMRKVWNCIKCCFIRCKFSSLLIV